MKQIFHNLLAWLKCSKFLGSPTQSLLSDSNAKYYWVRLFIISMHSFHYRLENLKPSSVFLKRQFGKACHSSVAGWWTFADKTCLFSYPNEIITIDTFCVFLTDCVLCVYHWDFHAKNHYLDFIYSNCNCSWWSVQEISLIKVLRAWKVLNYCIDCFSDYLEINWNFDRRWCSKTNSKP